MKCAKKRKKAVERRKKGLDRASIVRDGRFRDLSSTLEPESTDRLIESCSRVTDKPKVIPGQKSGFADITTDLIEPCFWPTTNPGVDRFGQHDRVSQDLSGPTVLDAIVQNRKYRRSDSVGAR